MKSGTRRPYSPVVRGELRQWREVYLRETSYFRGNIYNDSLGMRRNGAAFVTGFIISRIDRGDYWLVKTAGASVYLLWKDKEMKSC